MALAAAGLAPLGALDGGSLAGAQEAASTEEAPFQAYLQGFRGRALAQGVSARTLDQVLPTLTFNPRVVELDQAQPGGPVNGPAS